MEKIVRKKSNSGVDVYAAIGITYDNLLRMKKLPEKTQKLLDGKHERLLGQVTPFFKAGAAGEIIPHTADVQELFDSHNRLLHELPQPERGQFLAIRYKEKRTR